LADCSVGITSGAILCLMTSMFLDLDLFLSTETTLAIAFICLLVAMIKRIKAKKLTKLL
jgi:hypothetical protein